MIQLAKPNHLNEVDDPSGIAHRFDIRLMPEQIPFSRCLCHNALVIPVPQVTQSGSDLEELARWCNSLGSKNGVTNLQTRVENGDFVWYRRNRQSDPWTKVA